MEANEQEAREEKKKKSKNEPRTEPGNLEEQLTLEEAKAGAGKAINEKWNDPKYPEDTWEKIGHIHEKNGKNRVDIHYWRNKITNEKHGFKFKNPPPPTSHFF